MKQRTDIKVKEVEVHKWLRLQIQVLNGTYLVNCRWDCWIVGIEKGTKDVVGKEQDQKWQEEDWRWWEE